MKRIQFALSLCKLVIVMGLLLALHEDLGRKKHEEAT